MKSTLVILSLFLCAISSHAETSNEKSKADIVNIDEVIKGLKLDRFKDRSFNRKLPLRIAILDIGFLNHEKEIEAKALPANTVYDNNGPQTKADTIQNVHPHGTIMAKILAEVIQKSGVKANYEMTLFYAYGLPKFQHAIETIIKQKFDIVLYAQTWEDGGNGDGKGFINALVTDAIQKTNLIWINASNEYGGHMRRFPLKFKLENGENWVLFPSKKGKESTEAQINCHAPKKEKCLLHLSAIWNDFTDNPKVGTNQDLDLFLYDENRKLLFSSERIQLLAPNKTVENSSIIPLEDFDQDITKGKYFVKIKKKNDKFTAESELKLLATGKYVEILNPEFDETIFPPADNEHAVVVGASDDPDSSRSKKLKKPDVVIPSLVNLRAEGRVYSSSVSAALAAAVTAIHLGTGDVQQNREAVIAMLKNLDPTLKVAKAAPAPTSINAKSTTTLNPITVNAPSVTRGRRMAAGASQTCYPRARLQDVYPQLAILLNDGAVPIVYRGRIVISINPNYAAVRRLLPPDPSFYNYITPAGVVLFSMDEVYDGLPRNDDYMIYAGHLIPCS